MAKIWTPKDEKYLTSHYGKVSNAELAKHFGVTVKSVINKMSSLRKTVPSPAKKPVAKKTKPAATKKPGIIPLSQITKRRAPKSPVTKKAAEKPEVEEPPEYVPTGIMILTEDGWKPITIDKRKIKS